MKKLLVGLLALGSISAFTCEVVVKADLNEDQLSKLYRNNIETVTQSGNSQFLILESSTNQRAYRASDGYSLCQSSFCGTILANATVKAYAKNQSGDLYVTSKENFKKSRTYLIPINGHKASVKLGKLESKVIDKAISEVVEICKNL